MFQFVSAILLNISTSRARARARERERERERERNCFVPIDPRELRIIDAIHAYTSIYLLICRCLH